MNFLLDATARANLIIDGDVWPKAAEASAVLKQAGVGDDECASIIDVAGQILRSHRLFWTEPSQTIFVDTMAQTVLMRFNVDVTYEQAAALNIEAIDLLIERNLDGSQFKIDFVGACA